MLNRMRFSSPTLQRLSYSLHFAGLAALIGFGFLGWKIQASIQDWRLAMEQDIERDRQLISDMERIESQFDQAITMRDDVSATFRALRERVPRRLIDSDILRELEKMVTACDCKLNDFRPIGSQNVDTKELKCKVRSFQLSMNGSYAGLFELAQELETFPFLLQIKKLHLSAPADGHSDSRIEMEIGILYEPEWGESELITADRA